VPSRVVAFVASLALIATACAGGGGSVRRTDALADAAVTVASFDFGESVLLAELYAQALEARGIPVVRELHVGPRELVEPALETGLVELVPEYAGSLLEFVAGGSASASLGQTRLELTAALGRRGLVPLASASAQNRNGFAVTRLFARELDVDALSDLSGREGLVLGGPPECETRPLCLPGLEGTYGIDVDAFVPLDQSGPLTADALVRGVVDVGLMFTTSAELIRRGLVLLEDDRHLQPAEHVTPVVRRDTLERFGPELIRAVNGVSGLLTTEELRLLNAEVEVARRAPAAVAREWLAEHGLLGGEG
jgi:osmoprotectant transport system substrate-binding protein